MCSTPSLKLYFNNIGNTIQREIRKKIIIFTNCSRQIIMFIDSSTTIQQILYFFLYFSLNCFENTIGIPFWVQLQSNFDKNIQRKFWNQLDYFYHVLHWSAKEHCTQWFRTIHWVQGTKVCWRNNEKYGNNNPIYFEIFFGYLRQNYRKNIVTKPKIVFQWYWRYNLKRSHWVHGTMFFCRTM